MLHFLSENPDLYTEVHDDLQAKAFLLELGLLAKLQEPTPVSGPQVRLATLDTHPTHVFAAFRFVGHPKKSDNGFVVKCYPRSKFSLDQIDALIHVDMTKAQAGTPALRKKFSIDPQS